MKLDAHSQKILVVDDVPVNVVLLDRVLRSEHYEVIHANSGEAAINKARAYRPDLIILDIAMPNVNGYEVCLQLKKDDEFRDIPVIFISALTKTEDKLKALSAGGVDYITKPFQAEEVLARVAVHLEIRSLQKQLEEKNTILEAEIKKRKDIEEKLKKQAATDNLTKVFNRRYFFEAASRELSRSKRFGKNFSIIMFDIDHFKSVNDTRGHLFGDWVLIEVCQMVQENLRKYDLLGRYGGEEFVIMLPDTDLENATEVAERLRTTILNTAMSFGNHGMSITASFGVTCLRPGKDISIELVLDRADQALYLSKQNGRNRVTIWE